MFHGNDALRNVRPSAAAAADRPEWRGPLVRYLPIALALAVALILSGCASMSKDECTAADWYTIGVEDGAKGQPVSRIGAHRKACAKVGVTPDINEYNRGRAEGLKTFCTYDRGYAEGKRGASDRGVCPAGQLQNDFLAGYQAGRHVYDINQQIRGLESQLAQVRTEKADIEAGLEGNYIVEADGKKRVMTSLERRLLFDKLKDLNRQEAQLETQIAGLRASIAGS